MSRPRAGAVARRLVCGAALLLSAGSALPAAAAGPDVVRVERPESEILLLALRLDATTLAETIPAYGDRVTAKNWTSEEIVLERFEEMARFNYGSTAIVLLPQGVAELAGNLRAEAPVKLGERLATRLS